MPARPISHAMTTTAPAIEGYRATKTLGVVRGLTVRSRSVFGTIGASLQTLVGGNISLLTSLCEKTREDFLRTDARARPGAGANAVVAIHYDATEVMPGVTEVLCYGTAVVLAPVSP
ncbi:MAG: YbjQ family protein [Gemmatimonadota bacterium]|nr:YbjQ family protein [Gemmatimonadota bacterium]